MSEIIFEHTDTFGGESNYSWVRRDTYDGTGKSNLAIVRAAKKFAGISGVPSKTRDFGDMLAIYPRGICQVVFVMWV